MNLKKIANNRLFKIIFWWPIALWKVCKRQERFEGLVCTSICVTALFAFLTYKEGFDLRPLTIWYVLLGIIFSFKILWKNDNQQEITLQEQNIAQ